MKTFYRCVSERNITFFVFTVNAKLLLNAFNNHFYVYSYSVF